MAYAPVDDASDNDAAKIGFAQQIYGRRQSLPDTPAELYLTKTKRLPAGAVRACPDLHYLPSPIEGRPVVDHALVPVLRDATGQPCGLQLEFCDVLGARAAAPPHKQTYALREHGVRDGLFHAGGGPGAVAYLTESYSCDALAVASLGMGPTYGGGGRGILGCAVPPEPTVVIVPDRRPPDGPEALEHDRDYKRAVDLLLLAGKTVLVAKAPDCQHPCGGGCKDATDVLRQHGPIRLKELVETTEASALSLDGVARQLAQVDDPLERDVQIKARATELKVRVALLRDRVTHYRERGRSAVPPEPETTGSELAFEELQPATEKQDGAELLDDIAAAIRRHVFLDDADLVKAVLWTVHGHRRFHGNTAVLPRLIITAGRWDSGKSSLARVLKHLSDIAHYTISPTPSNIFRPIEEHKCAFFLDEADNWFPRSEGMRDIINSGFSEEEANVLRTEDTGAGGRRVLKSRSYSTFAPISIVGLNLECVLPQPLISRAVVIHMRPARVGEVAEEVTGNRGAIARLRVLAARIKRWAGDNEIALTAADPALPESVVNRLKLVWKPLVAIADRAGGAWPERARVALEIDRGRERDPNLGEQLLLDIRQIVAAHGSPVADDTAMHTGPIIERLLLLELRTWSVFGKARTAIRDTDLARLLAPYEIRPHQIKIHALNRNGYRLTELEAAIARYVISDMPVVPDRVYPSTTTENPSSAAGFEGSLGASTPDPTSTSGVEVDPTSDPAPTGFTEENRPGRRVGSTRPPNVYQTSGNGLDADVVVDEVLESSRCGFCACTLNGEASEQIGNKRYHSEACAAEARKHSAAPAAVPEAPPPTPPKKRSRIKRPRAN